MPARTRKLAKWRLALAGTLGLGAVLSLHGQEPKKDKTLPESKVEAPAPAEPAPEPQPQPPPFNPYGPFFAPPVTGYRAGSATTGTVVNVPLIVFPGTIDVVPQAILQDQQALRLQDILRDVPGATKLGDFRRPDNLMLRGFEVRSRDFRKDGYRDPFEGSRDFANVERVEFLQGPASVLYGVAQPSGVVNYITKKPFNDFYFAADVQPGSFGLIRSTVDANLPVDADGHFLFRVNAAYEDGNSFRDFGFDERTFVSPSLTWVIDHDTSWNVQFEYLNDRRHFDTGVIAFPNAAGVRQVGLVPISQAYNDPGDFQRFEQYLLSTTFVHQFSDTWALRIGGNAMWDDNPFAGNSPFGFVDDFGLGFLGLGPDAFVRRSEQAEFPVQYYSVKADLVGEVQNHFKHKFVLGTELSYYQIILNGLSSDPLGGAFAPFPPFFNPYGPNGQVIPPFVPLPQPFAGAGNFDTQQWEYGLYFQDMIEISERWKVLAGVRYDIARTDFARSLSLPIGGFNLGFPFVDSVGTDYRLTPRVGLVYQPIPEMLSFYGSYSQSFDPNAGAQFSNAQPLLPEIGASAEGGLKADFLDKRLSLTVAGFSIQKENVITQTSTLFATQIGKQRSQGAELGLVGNITDQWSIIANYAYTDSRITDATLGVSDFRFRNVPYNAASLWTRYNLIDRGRNVFGLAGGMVYVGDREGTVTPVNPFLLPGYTRFDAGAYLQHGPYTASVYLENIFDRQYYTSSVDSLTVFPGAPFNARAMFGVRF